MSIRSGEAQITQSAPMCLPLTQSKFLGVRKAGSGAAQPALTGRASPAPVLPPLADAGCRVGLCRCGPEDRQHLRLKSCAKFCSAKSS